MTISVDQHNEKTASPMQIISSIKKIQTPMEDVREILVRILRQYHAADKVGMSLGVMNSSSSFSNHLRWDPIVEKLGEKKESLDDVGKSQLLGFMNYLETTVNSFEEKVVVNIQKCRDKWMRRVLVLDISSVFIVSAFITYLVLYLDITLNEEIVISVFSYRPVFYSLALLIVLGMAFLSHCYFRGRVMTSMLNDNNALAVGMSMGLALQKNTRLRHSVFRPAPVGWNVFQKIRLRRMRAHVVKLRQQLDEVISHYPNNSEPDKKPE